MGIKNRRALLSFIAILLCVGIWAFYHGWMASGNGSKAQAQAVEREVKNAPAAGTPLAVKTVAPSAGSPNSKGASSRFIAGAKPVDMPSATEKDRFLKNTRILQERVTSPDENGRFTKKRVVEADFKYRLLRMEEKWTRDPATGAETMQEQLIMVADHLVVSLQDGQTEAQLQTVLTSLGGKVRRHLPKSQVYLVALASSDLDLFDAKLAEFRDKAAAVKVAEPDYVVFAAMTPNDPSYSVLWGMHNTGQTGGTVDADIDAPEAWDVSRGSSSVVVGVIDTGIDYTHPDLAANMWVNPGEIAGNGIDDDNNGYIDDTRGWDFVSDDNNPADDHYHGTHCAGTIGAVGNNNVGVAGVCHTVRMMALKFLSVSGGGTTSDAIEAVLYATAKQVTMTSNSWAGGGFSQTLKNAIDAAGTAGILFVAAAGNDTLNMDVTPSYPAGYTSTNIISVAATDSTDTLATFSNYGAQSVDLAAPGVSIYSTSPGNTYRYLSGTSMACPHVAGACALIKAVRPTATAAELKTTVMDNVDAITGLTGKMITSGRMNLARPLLITNSAYITLSSVQCADGGQPGTAGNSDGVLNPGEEIALGVTFKNIGTVYAPGLNTIFTVNSVGNKVTPVTSGRVWGNVNPGVSITTGSTPFYFKIAANTVTPHNFTVVLTTADTAGHSWITTAPMTVLANSTVTGRVTAFTGGAGLGAAVISYTGTTVGAPSGSVVAASDGTYTARLVNGTYELRASAANHLGSSALTVTVPPNLTAQNFRLYRPRLQVTPASLVSTQAEDVVATKTLTVTNNGDSPLTFTMTPAPRTAAASAAVQQASLSTPPAPFAEPDGRPESENSAGLPTGQEQAAAAPATVPFVDGFESDSLDGWVTGSGVATRAIVSDTAATGSKSFYSYYADTTNHETGIRRDFAAGAQPKNISFWVRSGSTATHDGYFVVRDATNNADFIFFYTTAAGKFYVNNSVTGSETFSYQARVWYRVEFRNLNWVTKTFDYYVNSNLIKANIPFRNPTLVDEVSSVSLYNFSTGSEAWWDDIRFTNSNLDWLSLAPDSSTLAAGQSVTVTASFNPAGKAYGEHLGQIEIASNDPASPVTILPASMTIVMPPNTPPVVDSQTLTLDEDTQATVTLTGSDAEGHALTTQIVSLPALGSLYQTTNGTTRGTQITSVPTTVSNSAQKVIFVPPANVSGIPYATFQFIMVDKYSQSTPGTVTLNVTPINDPPVVIADSYTLRPGASLLSFRPEANDRDAEGDTLSTFSFTQGTSGVVSRNADGSLRYTPNAGFLSGTDTFTYTVRDAPGAQATGNVQIVLNATYTTDWPTLGGGSDHAGYSTVHLRGIAFTERWQVPTLGASRPLAVAEGRVFSTVATPPTVVALDAVTGSEVWRTTFASGVANAPTWLNTSLFLENGAAASTRLYSLNASTGATRWSTAYTATASPSNTYPPAVDGTGVFFNDASAKNIRGFNAVTGASLFSTTSATYDQFSPLLRDGSLYIFRGGILSNLSRTTGTIAWNVSLGWNASASTSMDRTTAFADGRFYVVNDSVVTPATDKELVCVTLSPRAVTWRVQGAFSGTPAVAHQTVYVIADSKTIKGYDALTGAYLGVYSLPGTDTGLLAQPLVTYDTLIASSATKTYVFDLSSRTLLQTLPYGGSLSVAGQSLYIASGTNKIIAFSVPDLANNAPVALAQQPNVTEDQPATFTLQGTDADSDALTFTITTIPALGTLYQTPDGTTRGTAITTVPSLVTHALGKVIYQPPQDQNGTALTTFQFAASDTKEPSVAATVTINVVPVNDAPIARIDSRLLLPAQILSPLYETFNDYDADGDVLTVTSFTQPTLGAVQRNDDGTLRYTAPANGTLGTTQFSYTVSDPSGLTSTSTVSLSILASINTSWPTFGNGPSHTGATPVVLGRSGWAQNWSQTTSLQVLAEAPAVGAGGLVFVTQNGTPRQISALYAGTGMPIWTRTFTAAGTLLGPPSYYNGRVHLQVYGPTNTSQMMALDAATGDTAWATSFTGEQYPFMAPAVSDLGVFVNVSSSAGLGGYALSNGASLFTQAKPSSTQWAPAIVDSEVYAFVRGDFVRHHPTTGAVLWTRSLGWGESTSPAAMKRTVALENRRAYLINSSPTTTLDDEDLVAINLDTQAVVWSLNGQFTGTPAVSNGIVYAISADSVQARSTADGNLLRSYSVPGVVLTGQPILTEDLLIVSSSTDTYLFGRYDQTLVQTLNIGGAPAVIGRSLVVFNHTTGALASWSGNGGLNLSPAGGTFAQPVNVVITGATSSRIHYTVDGSAPNLTSPWLTSGSTVSMGWTGTLRAISVNGSAVSRIQEATFTIADSDTDGIADWWEMQMFGNLTAANATSDFDHDGTPDVEEFVADTHPKSIADRFIATPAASENPADKSMTLRWQSKLGRLYVVEASADLSSWTPVTPVLRGTGGIMEHSTSMQNQTRVFNRVRVLPGLAAP